MIFISHVLIFLIPFFEENNTNYSNKCIELCELLNKYWFIILNDPASKSLSKLKNIVKSVIEFIDKYNIYLYIVNNFDVARIF